MLLQLGVEAIIDRQANIAVSASIYRFLIEDIYKEDKIAQPFRVKFFLYNFNR